MKRITCEIMDVTARRDEQPNSVSDGVPSSSLLAEMEPLATLALAPSGFNPNPILPVIPPGSVTSAPSSDAEAEPLLSSADPGPAGLEFETEVSALEAQWSDAGIMFGGDGVPTLLRPSPFARNARTLRIVAESAIAPADSISVSVGE